MSRSTHATLTAADRFERKANRRPVRSTRRTNTRSAVVLAALKEA